MEPERRHDGQQNGTETPARYDAPLDQRCADLEARDDWATHTVRHDWALLLRRCFPRRTPAHCLVLRAPRRTKTPPGRQGRFAFSMTAKGPPTPPAPPETRSR